MTIDDIKNLSNEELEQKIKLLDLEQNAVKILINSYYGASGANYFYFYDPDVAQSITLQGQDLIKFSVQAMNHFFRNKLHLEKDLHKELGIDQYEIEPIQKDVVIYVDTDSNFVWYHPAIESVKGMPVLSDDAALEFCLKIDELAIKPYLQKAFIKYAEKYNTSNRQDFELENASQEGIWLAKKNYILNVSYVDNEKRELLSSTKRYQVIKGLETVKGSYPKWARENLLKLYQELLKHGRNIDVDLHLIPIMKALKAEFMTLDSDAISFNFNLNNLDKYVIDLDTLTLAKGTGIVPRGTSYHNYLVRKTKSQKIREITAGQKVKQYHCDPTQNENGFDIFCYVPSEFPSDFAPPMDKDEQFYRLIINPINRFLEAYGMIPLDKNLNRVVEIVKSRSKKPVPDDKFYPLYVVDKSALEYVELPEKFWKIVGNPELQVAPEDFGEYLSYISKYDLNTVIVPNSELKKYIDRTKKKNDKKNAELLNDSSDDNDDE